MIKDTGKNMKVKHRRLLLKTKPEHSAILSSVFIQTLQKINALLNLRKMHCIMLQYMICRETDCMGKTQKR